MEFTDNNAKNTNTGYISFELNCEYHLWISYKIDLNPRSELKIMEKLSFKLRNLMDVCEQNLYHAHDFLKQAHNKGVKPQNYALGDKI